jgi:hypothetical protein
MEFLPLSSLDRSPSNHDPANGFGQNGDPSRDRVSVVKANSKPVVKRIQDIMDG